MLVAAVIVEDDVDDLASRDLAFDRIEEADELLMSVALHAAADDLALEHLEQRAKRILLGLSGELRLPRYALIRAK